MWSLSSSLSLNWSLNAKIMKAEERVKVAFNLQFNLKLEVKRQKWEMHQGAISTFKLQFNLKLELKRVRLFFSSRVAFSFPRLSFSLTLLKLKRASTKGIIGSVWRLSCSLSLNYNLNATLGKGFWAKNIVI